VQFCGRGEVGAVEKRSFEDIPLGREGKAVDGGVALADGADEVLDLGLAATVVLLADEENGSARFGRLLAKQVERVGDGVEDGRAAVAEFRMRDGGAPLGDVGSKGRVELRAAAEVDDGYLLGGPPTIPASMVSRWA